MDRDNKKHVQIKILDNYFNPGNLPYYATQGSAGSDLIASKSFTVDAGATISVQTGIAIHIVDKSLMGLILPRSGLGSKGLILANGTGVIDSDYQDELIVKLWNRTETTSFHVKQGERFAQLLIVPVVQVWWELVEEFDDNSYRQGGFGSTGG